MAWFLLSNADDVDSFLVLDDEVHYPIALLNFYPYLANETVLLDINFPIGLHIDKKIQLTIINKGSSDTQVTL